MIIIKPAPWTSFEWVLDLRNLFEYNRMNSKIQKEFREDCLGIFCYRKRYRMPSVDS